MKIKAFIANKIFMILNKKNYYLFLKSCNNPEFEQTNILLSIINKNKNSKLGKLYKFERIKTISDFQNYVPISTYEDYKPFIKSIMNGENNILTSENINYFALSSGSSSASKYIPYTSCLKQEFNSAINIWIYDLLYKFKSLKFGTQFWIITPVATNIKLPKSSISIGFEDDTEYFGKIEKNLIRSVMCLPNNINKIKDNNNYFYLLAYFLLIDRELRLISVWNPSLLISIFEFIRTNYKLLCRDISLGTINLPNNVKQDKKIADIFAKKNKKRGDYLSKIPEFCPESIKLIWQKLAIISCWTDAWANVFEKDINNWFQHTHIQGKGLLATEGVVSIPIKKLEYPVLTIKTHFYEFINIETKNICASHQLKIGEKYELLLTTGGGFYRYRLNDIVEIMGFFKKTALLKFISKSDIVSDVCGEKLNENFVADTFSIISKKFLIKKGIIFLAPQKNKNSFNYTLYIETGVLNNNIDKQLLLNDLDNELMKNFHYKHCRNMKQLSFPKLYILNKKELSEISSLEKNEKILSTKKHTYLRKY